MKRTNLMWMLLGAVIAAPLISLAQDWYVATGKPVQGSSLSSADMRTEFALIQEAMDKLPALAGNGSKLVAVNAAGTALDTLSPDITPESGTFTASFDSACTVTGTVTFDWQRIGNIVVIKRVGDLGLPCIGDSIEFATTGTPVPAAIRPGSVAVTPALAGFADNGVSTFGCMYIFPSGNVEFAIADGADDCDSGSWTAAGTRGIPDGWEFSYMLGNP